MNKPFHHVARAIIIKDGKVLLSRAKGYTNTFLPGGHVEFSESAKDAVVREIEEEMGMKGEAKQFLGLVEHKWREEGVIHHEINQVFEVDCPELNAQSSPSSKEDHLTFFWADPIQLEELEPSPFQGLIQDLLKGKHVIWWGSTLHHEIDDQS